MSTSTMSAAESTAWTLALTEVLGIHGEDIWDLHVAPDIKEKKLRNATAFYAMPDDERVLGLLDSTAMGSAKTGLAFGVHGVYFRNSTGSSAGTHAAPYSKLPGCDFDAGDKNEVGLPEAAFWIGASSVKVAALFRSLVHLLGAWHEQTDNLPDALPPGEVEAHSERVVADWQLRREREVILSETELEARGALAGAWALRLAAHLEAHRSTLGDEMWVAPDIPVKKLRTAIGRYDVPDDEVAIGLCAYTGSAKDGVLYGLRGIYLRTWEASPSGTYAVPYAQLAGLALDGDGNGDGDEASEVQVGDFSVPADDETKAAIVEVIRSVADLVRSWQGALDEHVTDFSDEQIDIERFEKTAVRHAKDAQTKFEMATDVIQELGG